MDKEMFKCTAEPLVISNSSPGPNLLFGMPYIREDGSAILISDTINGMTRIFDVKPETIRRFTGHRRKDGYVYEGDVYRNPNGDELTVIWSDDTFSWMCLYTKTGKPDSILLDARMALYVMPVEFEKLPYVPINDRPKQA